MGYLIIVNLIDLYMQRFYFNPQQYEVTVYE